MPLFKHIYSSVFAGRQELSLCHYNKLQLGKTFEGRLECLGQKLPLSTSRLNPAMVVLSITHNPAGPFLTHKATTFGGSSGAPLFKVVQGEPVVVALHCGCVPPNGPPQLNGGMLIAHILHHVFNGSFKEGRLIVPFPLVESFLCYVCGMTRC